jgi:aspartate aminotransferase
MITQTIEHKFSSRILNLRESATIAMTAKAKALHDQGFPIIKLSHGEPDFNTPLNICNAAKKGIDEGYFTYSPVAGFTELRKRIVDKFKRDNDLVYKEENIVVSTGAKQSLSNVILTLVDKEDEVIIFSPCWVTYVELVKLAQGLPVLVNGYIENDYKVRPEDLEKAITPRTKAVLFSSPGNPTGSVYSLKELEAFAKILIKYPDIYIISDEIYEYINFIGKHASIASFEYLKDRLIIVNGFSKSYAMTGWRVGYIAAPVEIAKACTTLQGQMTNGTCTIAQRAGIEAIQGGAEGCKEMIDAYQERRDIVKSMLDAIPGIKTYKPEGAFYILPDISELIGTAFKGEMIKNSVDFSMFLLTHAHVAVVDGDAFGAPNTFRISYATSKENLIEALKRIAKAVQMLER